MSNLAQLDPVAIRSTCRHLAPILREQIDYEGRESSSTWVGDGSNGKALEVLGIAWIAHAARELGLELYVAPDLMARPDLFYLRNTLPHSNAARAGHSDARQHSIIEESFLAALTPKLEIRSGERVWSVFREGLPAQAVLDYLRGREEWQDRPDILIVEGGFTNRVAGQLVTSQWSHGSAQWTFTLRALDSTRPHIVNHDDPLPEDFTSCALAEISLRKATAHVDAQLESYGAKYDVALSHTFFLHGGACHSTVAGLKISAPTILGYENDFVQLAMETERWLAASLSL